MKSGKLLTAGLMLSLILISQSCGNDGKGKNKDYTAPPVSGQDINTGDQVSLEQFKGKVVFLNFWATWCPPCRAEIPDLMRLQEKYKDDLVVLGVSVDRESVDVVRKFYQTMGMTYTVIMGDQQLTMSYGGIQSIPTSFIINRQGELVSKIVGSLGLEQFEAKVMPFIKEK